jgi:hypothetical protein
MSSSASRREHTPLLAMYLLSLICPVCTGGSRSAVVFPRAGGLKLDVRLSEKLLNGFSPRSPPSSVFLKELERRKPAVPNSFLKGLSSLDLRGLSSLDEEKLLFFGKEDLFSSDDRPALSELKFSRDFFSGSNALEESPYDLPRGDLPPRRSSPPSSDFLYELERLKPPEDRPAPNSFLNGLSSLDEEKPLFSGDEYFLSSDEFSRLSERNFPPDRLDFSRSEEFEESP